MAPDVRKYWKHVEHFDLSDDEKTELIRTVRSVMEAFVDAALGTHTVQQGLGSGAGGDTRRDEHIISKGARLRDDFARNAGPTGGKREEE